MKVYLATDHRGFKLKEKLKAWLAAKGYEVEDLGAHEHNPDDDYPDFVALAARAVSADPENSRGIVLGYSGQGEAMAANRIRGVRAAIYYGGPEEIAVLSRQHNDANILSLGAGFINEQDALRVAEKWLETTFGGEERHMRRIKKIDGDE